jgi:hypothetical protein
MKVDRFFDELFSYDSKTNVGSASEDSLDCNLLGSYSGIDIVASPKRRSGKPTVAGTRLEPKIISERVLYLTFEFMETLLPDNEFSSNTVDWIKKHYRDHPHDVPKIIPSKVNEWLSFHQIDDIETEIYEDQILKSYRFAVIEISTRRDYTYPRMIHAMNQYYDEETDHIETLRRHSYDTRHCMSDLGKEDNPVTLIQSKEDLQGYFVTEDGEKYENYSQFLKDSWDKKWPPENIKYLDHRATFGSQRPPG